MCVYVIKLSIVKAFSSLSVLDSLVLSCVLICGLQFSLRTSYGLHEPIGYSTHILFKVVGTPFFLQILMRHCS